MTQCNFIFLKVNSSQETRFSVIIFKSDALTTISGCISILYAAY
jgi:hypothetical protein